VLAELASVAELWGAEWQREGNGGRLDLPVQAGLRHGLLQIAATTTAVDGGTRLELAVHSQRWVLHKPATGMLVVAGLGSLAGVAWPFLPALTPVVPLALVLAVGAWLGVLSRLRNHNLPELVLELGERLRDAAASAEPATPSLAHDA
jgi:hypothetical protein